MRRLTIPFLILTVFASHAARAEVVLEAGAYFVYARDYDHETNTFSADPPAGEEDACYQITSVTNTPMISIDFVLVTGTSSPWWADGDVFEPGFENAFVDYPDLAYSENNPGQNILDLLAVYIKTVPSCPPPSS